MDKAKYHRTIQQEFDALKDRIRYLMDDPHWLTDGEWKESILRKILRRQLPEDIGVGHGFIITDQRCSKQIDILVYNTAYPMVFRDGDLVFLHSDAVYGMVSVKNQADNSLVSKAIEELVYNLEVLYSGFRHPRRMNMGWDGVAAFFSYESSADPKKVLSMLKEKAAGNAQRIVKLLSLGPSIAINFEQPFWNVYKLDDLAPAFIVNKIVNSASPDDAARAQDRFFPFDPAVPVIDRLDYRIENSSE